MALFVWWAEENKEVLVAWHQLLADVLTAVGVWGGENYLLNLGVCEDPETSGLPNGAVHVFVIWPEALGPLGGSTSVTPEREGSTGNMGTVERAVQIKKSSLQ